MPPSTNRARAAFLGLALGDAYGRPLEFVHLPQVRSLKVDITKGSFRWTDDTHMALYLAEAILEHGPGPVDPDRFGNGVGAQFSKWLDDPLTPSTAPGNTCKAGAENWRATHNWRTSGVATSDGCGAVMRICPLAFAFAGEDLTTAARISAVVTHGHPNAREAAIAASHLLRWTLEAGEFNASLVTRAIEGLRGPWNEGGVVANALEAAIAEGSRAGEWLDEHAVPNGDGGWKSPSALGLAVAAALRWRHDFALAVEKAARIEGDSDSVACLTGMFLGAADGTKVLPGPWLEVLPERARIEQLSERLVVLSP
jgi:ADP-ribosylglycohydrolase